MTSPSRPPAAEALDLQPHPEGGWFRETFRSAHTFTPDGYAGERSAVTLIHYLLEPGDESAWHVVASDEIWIWNTGGTLELRLGGDGDRPSSDTETTTLGAGTYQCIVPARVWQSARPTGDQAVLVTCVVAPGFDFADFRMA